MLLHVTVHPSAQSMSHDEVSVHETVLPAPRLNLQFALPEQVAVELAPAFSWHFDDELQAMRLAAPPIPLHSDVSPQVIVVAPVPEALHFEAVSQVRLHGPEPQLALQSVPAVQVQAAATHMHPAPLHVGAVLLLLPHASAAHAAMASARISILTVVISIWLSSASSP